MWSSASFSGKVAGCSKDILSKLDFPYPTFNFQILSAILVSFPIAYFIATILPSDCLDVEDLCLYPTVGTLNKLWVLGEPFEKTNIYSNTPKYLLLGGNG